jgi:hypothetical protein
MSCFLLESNRNFCATFSVAAFGGDAKTTFALLFSENGVAVTP